MSIFTKSLLFVLISMILVGFSYGYGELITETYEDIIREIKLEKNGKIRLNQIDTYISRLNMKINKKKALEQIYIYSKIIEKINYYIYKLDLKTKASDYKRNRESRLLFKYLYHSYNNKHFYIKNKYHFLQNHEFNNNTGLNDYYIKIKKLPLTTMNMDDRIALRVYQKDIQKVNFQVLFDSKIVSIKFFYPYKDEGKTGTSVLVPSFLQGKKFILIANGYSSNGELVASDISELLEIRNHQGISEQKKNIDFTISDILFYDKEWNNLGVKIPQNTPYHFIPIIKNNGKESIQINKDNLSFSVSYGNKGQINGIFKCKLNNIILNPGEELICDGPIGRSSFGNKTGEHEINIKIDYNSQFQETNEDNNTFGKSFEIVDSQ